MLEKGAPAQQANNSLLWLDKGKVLFQNPESTPGAESEGGFPESLFLFNAAFHPHLDRGPQ